MRFLFSLVILAFFAGCCLSGLTPVQNSSGETIASFDMCSPGSPGSTDNITTVAEPVFDITTFMPSIKMSEDKVINLVLSFTTRIDKPPTI
jgi:hypothetical protein